MLRRLYFSIRHGSYLRSEHGIKKFAEMAMGQLIRKVTKKSAFYREMNENLLVEKANLRLRAEELFEQPMLTAGEFFSVRRRLWANGFIITAAIAASVFLIFISVSAFLGEDAAVSGFLQWSIAAVLACVMTGGGLIVSERLIETLLPQRSDDAEELGEYFRPVAILWIVLLVGIELALFGITEVRAEDLGTRQASGALYFGFIALSMMLPIIAGAIRWDAMRYIDRYKTTRAHREIDSRLAQIDSILRQNEEYESNFYKIKSIEYWDLLNEFRTYKDLYNERHGMMENIQGHFAQSYDAFQREAYKRYESDLRDLTSFSMRRIDMLAEKPAGRKIGQVGKLHSAPMPVTERGTSTSARSTASPERLSGASERPAGKSERSAPERIAAGSERTTANSGSGRMGVAQPAPARSANPPDRRLAGALPAAGTSSPGPDALDRDHESDIYMAPKPIR